MDESTAATILQKATEKRAGLMDGKPGAPPPRRYLPSMPSTTRPTAPNAMLPRSLGRGIGAAATLGVGGLIAHRILGFLNRSGASGAPGAINNALTGKQGNEDAILSAAQQAVNDQVKQQALSNIGRTAMGGLGVGAAAAGVGGLLQLLSKPLKYRNTPNFVSIPYPVRKKEETTPPVKMAGVGDFLAGNVASTVHGVPWYYPGLVAGGAGGALLGHGLVKKFLRHRKEKEQERELAGAQDEFQKAMLGQYSSPLKVALDKLYDRLEKEDKIATLADMGGQALGAYGAMGLLTGAAGASVGYNIAKKYRRRKVLDEAMKARMRQRFMASPPELIAVPTPVSKIPQMDKAEKQRLLTQPEIM